MSQPLIRFARAAAVRHSRHCAPRSAISKTLLSQDCALQQVLSWRPANCIQQQQQCRSVHGPFRSSRIALEEAVVNLPGLGDSISEGTVVQWAKDVGDVVEVGDILAVIETDKVSIEIQAEQRGKLVKRHAAIDDRLEVGAPLYTLDTEGAPAKEEPPQPERTPQPKAEDSATYSAHAAGASYAEAPRKHVPLIKFKGKRSRDKQTDSSTAKSTAAAAASKEPHAVHHTPGALDFDQVIGGALFGRPHFTQAEIDAIESGGADCAPQGKIKNVWSSA